MIQLRHVTNISQTYQHEWTQTMITILWIDLRWSPTPIRNLLSWVNTLRFCLNSLLPVFMSVRATLGTPTLHVCCHPMLKRASEWESKRPKGIDYLPPVLRFLFPPWNVKLKPRLGVSTYTSGQVRSACKCFYGFWHLKHFEYVCTVMYRTLRILGNVHRSASKCLHTTMLIYESMKQYGRTWWRITDTTRMDFKNSSFWKRVHKHWHPNRYAKIRDSCPWTIYAESGRGR